VAATCRRVGSLQLSGEGDSGPYSHTYADARAKQKNPRAA